MGAGLGVLRTSDEAEEDEEEEDMTEAFRLSSAREGGAKAVPFPAFVDGSGDAEWTWTLSMRRSSGASVGASGASGRERWKLWATERKGESGSHGMDLHTANWPQTRVNAFQARPSQKYT